MHPMLQEYDKISLLKSDSYCAGDILVFQYRHYEFLVHRLLQIKDGIYYCKGDNSFRLEAVELANIFGKVISVCRNDNIIPLPDVNDSFINHSLLVNYELQQNNDNVKKTINSEIYRQYFSKYILGDALFTQI